MTKTLRTQVRGALLGLSAAALFGLSAPIAKRLLDEVPTVLLAGLLYSGAAIALSVYRSLAPPTREAMLTRADYPRLGVIILAGGMVGPVLMLLGLGRVTALTGSLLLNLEAPLTVLVAVLFFGEHLGRWPALAVTFIVAGAALLRLEPGEIGGDWAGTVLLAGACGAWALDNNLTQTLSLKDPVALVRAKTLVAGGVNTVLGIAIADRLPSAGFVFGALLLGSLSYGLSVVLDAYALRAVGAAREAAYFATAPFVGAAASIWLLGDPLGPWEAAGMGSMVLGVLFLLREDHTHEHVHETMEHDHMHMHDAHHQHGHGPGDPPFEPHSHMHTHEPLIHTHPHVPDAHHRHRH